MSSSPYQQFILGGTLFCSAVFAALVQFSIHIPPGSTLSFMMSARGHIVPKGMRPIHLSVLLVHPGEYEEIMKNLLCGGHIPRHGHVLL